MKKITCLPRKLPFRHLHWEEWMDFLGKAHAILARFDEVIKSVSYPEKVFSLLTAYESVASLQSQKISMTVEDMFLSQQKPFSHDKTVNHVLHYQKALQELAKLPSSHPISSTLLCNIHAIIKKNSNGNQRDIGKMRDRQNWIGPEGKGIDEAYFFPPRVSKMYESLDNLKKYMQYKEKDPLVQLAIFFAQLLIIHPFMDGNGRVARALIPFFLYKKKLLSSPLFYLSSYFRKHRLEYFERLFECSEDNDWGGWIRFFLRGIVTEGEILLQKARKILHLYQELIDSLEDSVKVRKQLTEIFTLPIMKKEEWEECKQSCKTMKILEEKKWIIPYKKEAMVAVSRLLTIV